MAKPLRDPRESIVRNVLLYPADGSEPRITSMTFSVEGSRSNPYGLFTINVDLRGVYGEGNMHATMSKPWHIVEQPDKNLDGEYDAFHNISPRLPINASMARLVGVDPKKPGPRPMWRGDVVVVKMAEWPEPLKRGGGAHKDYMDVPPGAQEFFTSRCIPLWYNSEEWQNTLEDERKFNEARLKTDREWPAFQKMFPMLSGEPSGVDKKKRNKMARMIDRLKVIETKQVQRQVLDNIVACGHCKADGSSIANGLRVCGGCRNEKYCSTQCQKLAWKYHKVLCRASA
ncbi:hypothetical protein B0H10DRAFT_1984286 [Mycena sp. CBHHK59/15]|nr:hypothetical protein B0H10DRAFT_1984286 [Mycena sp. CBHHK59/15]